MANVFYDNGKKYLINGAVSLLTDTIKFMLVTSAYTPDAANHGFRSDVTNEVTGTGYTAGGVTLASKTVTADTVNHRGVFTAADISLPSSTITARGGVLYKSRGGLASADEIVGYVDFGSDIASTNGTFTVQWSASGILYIG